MLLISETSHPKHRPMTAVSAVATFMDNLKPGANEMPTLMNDVRGGKIVGIPVIRALIKRFCGTSKVATRVIDGKLVVYLLDKGD